MPILIRLTVYVPSIDFLIQTVTVGSYCQGRSVTKLDHGELNTEIYTPIEAQQYLALVLNSGCQMCLLKLQGRSGVGGQTRHRHLGMSTCIWIIGHLSVGQNVQLTVSDRAGSTFINTPRCTFNIYTEANSQRNTLNNV